ncbi:MAG: hypothetical protein COA73_03880 [Candidatus Hydrogenedentota bacterium]|nr:MAG: hypothetical protein COA73_03880 [Candidatus Hydrogenedentota bacterium]
MVVFPASTHGLKSEEITLAEILKNAGYATAMFGKWHLGHQPGMLPTDQGFDRYIGVPYSHDMKPLPLLDGKKTISDTVDLKSLTRRFTDNDLPSGKEKRELYVLGLKMLKKAGYQEIGMDHFALPDDELAVALDERHLFRNFMGYTTVAAQEMVGVGPSAISRIGGVYAQNEKRLVYYYRHLDEGHLPTMAGCALTADDEIRGWVIQQLMCNLQLDFSQLASEFDVAYDDYFGEEDAALKPYYDDGFLARTETGLHVLPLGQVFLRNIAMVFDAYLKSTDASTTFSRTV